MEAPDECGHRHEVENKVKSIELIDEKVVGFLRKALSDAGIDYKMMILPDHPTPLCLRTHTRDGVPYIIYDSRNEVSSGVDTFTEKTARSTGIVVEKGCNLMRHFI